MFNVRRVNHGIETMCNVPPGISPSFSILNSQCNVTAQRPSVNVNDGDAGNGRSVGAIPITATIRPGHSAHGKSEILTTGANTAARTQSIASATARSNANATRGGAIP